MNLLQIKNALAANKHIYWAHPGHEVLYTPKGLVVTTANSPFVAPLCPGTNGIIDPWFTSNEIFYSAPRAVPVDALTPPTEEQN